MKKLFLLLLLISAGAHAQVVPGFNLSDFVKQTELEKVNKRLDALEKGVVIPPVDTLKPCERDPSIGNIYNVTPTSATVQFDARDVFGLTLSITSVDNSTKAFTPRENTLYYTYPKLSPGEYELNILPTTCRLKEKAKVKKFTVPKETGDGGGGNPPVDPTGYKLETIAKGMDAHMNLTTTQYADSVVITDNADVSKPDNYEFVYGIGNDIIRRGEPLKNYSVAGHNPFRAWKMIGKKGLDTFVRWDEKLAQQNDWFWADAGYTFSYNSSIAFNTFSVKGPQDKAGFLNHIPQSYDPSAQMVQWADIVPDLTLPKGHMVYLKRGEWSKDQVLKKGVTHLSHQDLPWTDINEVIRLKKSGITYNDVPRIREIFNLPDSGRDSTVYDYNGKYNYRYWPNGPYDEGKARASARGKLLDALWIGETLEGGDYIDENHPMWGYFNDELRKEYEKEFGARGIPWYICHNYYSRWPDDYNLNPGEDNRVRLKTMGRMSAQALPRSIYSPGGTMSRTTLVTEAIYWSSPDQVGALSAIIYRMNILKHLGYETGIFLAPEMEWRPNNPYQVNYPDGKLFFHSKIPHDPATIIAAAFFSQVYGKVYVDWGSPGKGSTKDFNDPSLYDPNGYPRSFWFPNGSTEARPGFPHVSSPGGYYPYNGGVDLGRFGIQLAADTWLKLNGGKTQYLKFRLNGGKWQTVKNDGGLDEIVDAYIDQVGFVYSIEKDGKIAWFYYNEFGKNKYKTLEVELPNGRVVSDKVAGNGIHAKIESL